MLNEYNKKTANAVQSIPIHSLFVVSTKTETSLGTVHWYLAFRVMNCRLDLGKETMSCYIEITDDSQQSSDLQLLSIRYSFLPYMTHSWSSLTSLDLIDRVFSLRIVYTLSSSSENDFLLPFLPSNENSLCIRIAFSNQDEFSISILIHIRHSLCKQLLLLKLLFRIELNFLLARLLMDANPPLWPYQRCDLL